MAFRLKWWWRVGRQWAAGVCLIAGAMGWACGTESGPGPQRLAEDQIKAGFLFNFTRFVEWSQAPQQAPFTPVVLCIVDDPGIADLLSAASVGKVVNGRTVTIRRGRVGEEFRGCNVVFVGDTSERHAAQIVEGVKGANVLTVGEAQGFTRVGGMVNLVQEENQVRLVLNLGAAQRAGLKISAKLISVARVVGDGGGG